MAKPVGRPRLTIDWDQVKRCAHIQRTQEQAARFQGISVDTLALRCKEELGLNFTEFWSLKKEAGIRALSNKQWECAENGDRVMLIWLGKQHLEQKDETHNHTEISPNLDKANQLLNKLKSALADTI